VHDFKDTSLDFVPRNIGNLIHLKYLSFRNTCKKSSKIHWHAPKPREFGCKRSMLSKSGLYFKSKGGSKIETRKIAIKIE